MADAEQRMSQAQMDVLFLLGLAIYLKNDESPLVSAFVLAVAGVGMLAVALGWT